MIRPKVTPPTAAERLTAYNQATHRDQNTCQRCRRDCGPIARDHRKNRSTGGSTTVENLQLLGLECHQWKTEHPADATAEGWAVPGWADPLTYPARRWIETRFGILTLVWVLYNRAGTWFEIEADEAARRITGKKK